MPSSLQKGWRHYMGTIAIKKPSCRFWFNRKKNWNRQMKKLYLLLLILPALACFTGNKIQVMNVPPTIATTPIPFKSAVSAPHLRLCVRHAPSPWKPWIECVGWLSSGDLVSILDDPPRRERPTNRKKEKNDPTKGKHNTHSLYRLWNLQHITGTGE